MNKILILTIIILNIFHTSILISNENKVLFKISNNSFTSLDLENRIKYLGFVGDNTTLTDNEIMKDFVSANLFKHYYLKTKSKNDFKDRVNKIYLDVLEINLKNNKFDKDKIDKENIFKNLELDLIRKSIIENFINNEDKDFFDINDNIDLIYNFSVEYINFDINNFDHNKNILKNLNFESLNQVESFLKNNDIKYIKRINQINDIRKINKKIKDNIYLKKNFFKIENNGLITFFSINKQFQTYDSLSATLYDIRSEKKLVKNDLLCEYLKTNNFNSKEYEFEKLNEKIKKNLIEINDFIEIKDNDFFIYIVLCDIKFNKDLINNIILNKKINKLVKNIENSFIEEYSQKFNLIYNNE